METARFKLFLSMVVLALTAGYGSGAFIEVPDELLDSAPVISLRQDGLREKRQVSVKGEGSEHAGTLTVQGAKNIFDSGKTSVDGTASYHLDYAKGMKPIHEIGLGAQATHNIFDNGKTQADLKGSYNLDKTLGQKPFHDVSLGAGVTHNIWKGRRGESLDVYGGVQRDLHFGPYPRPHGWSGTGGLSFTF